MKAGRELDALIAEKVMGWKVVPGQYKHIVPPNAQLERSTFCEYVTSSLSVPAMKLPTYSTDIRAAWEIVEKLCPQEDEFQLKRFNKKEWDCNFSYFMETSCQADTAPHAICLAALKAVGYEVKG